MAFSVASALVAPMMRGDRQALVVGILLAAVGVVLALMAFAGAPETQAWHVPAGIVGAALGVVIVRGAGRDG